MPRRLRAADQCQFAAILKWFPPRIILMDSSEYPCWIISPTNAGSRSGSIDGDGAL
jgi:hypothetical protein